MATISRSEAEALANFLPYALDRAFVPFSASNQTEPSVAIRLLMEELGIAGNANKFGGPRYDVTVNPQSTSLLLATDLGILIRNGSAKEIKFFIPGQPLTQAAKELIPIARLNSTDFELRHGLHYLLANKRPACR